MHNMCFAVGSVAFACLSPRVSRLQHVHPDMDGWNGILCYQCVHSGQVLEESDSVTNLFTREYPFSTEAQFKTEIASAICTLCPPCDRIGSITGQNDN